jgi:electron transfer flavoprotein beta subunit
MRIIICIKAVPDTAASVRIKSGSAAIDPEGLTYVMNPYDEFAVEEALRIKEKHGQTETTAVSLGGKIAKDVLRTALSMGVDRAIHLQDPAFDELDSQATAQVLARAVGRLEFDLVLCGKQAVDMDAAQVGPALAELLGLSQIGVVTRLEFDGDWKTLRAHRQIEGGVEVIEGSLPCVITTQKGLNEPRYPSLKGILSAKKKEIPEWGLAQLAFGEGEVKPSATRIASLQLPPLRMAGRILEGESQDKVKELVRLLRQEAKVL